MQEFIGDIHVCIPTTRKSNIVWYEYSANTEINDKVNEDNSGSISQHNSHLDDKRKARA